ncbi:conserved hypothetical protein [delta proteobacterium NaphS2]|nr:conserved hypothetical protein [delta proteobacterium NaphS2]
MGKITEGELARILNSLEEKKIFTLDTLVSFLSCSVPTARLKLKQWGTYTSYNQNGRYYTMPSVPRFDDNGLWHYSEIYFSQYGPDGHPKSPTCGHLKIPHPASLIFQ